jgi:anti-anti-sigma factor
MTLHLPLHDLPRPTVGVLAETGSDRLVVRVNGEIDIATHDELTTLMDALDVATYDVVELHLEDIEFCDSTGVRQLLAFAEKARAAGRTVELRGARPQLARMLALVAPASAA